MCMATLALLSWAVTAACGLNPSQNCTKLAPYETLLKRFRHCNVTIENGYVHAVCNILVRFRQAEIFFPEYSETLTMEHLLVSNEPVGGATPEGSSVCLSLRSVTIRKWENFRLEKNQKYDFTLSRKNCSWGVFMCRNLLVLLRQMTFKGTFGEPPQVAVAVCNRTQGGKGCNFEVYGFLDGYQYDVIYFFFSRGFIEFWNIRSLRMEVVNVTFVSRLRKIPDILFISHAISTIKQFIFYNCNFVSIKPTELPSIINLERLEFFHTPIEEIGMDTPFLRRHLRYSSLVGTKLPGIPQTIFNMKRLETLDMSDTNVPRDIEFQYCPGKCTSNSSLQQLILSRTNLTSLPNRAFCGFPLIKRLELENCHIAQLSGSPFECLGNLHNLTMPGNKITSLDTQNMKGLKKLDFLNLSKNRFAHFEGPQIFSTLISLRRLILSQNEITTLQLGPVEYVPIEELKLVHNRISSWKPPFFSSMGKLETLLLEHNEISSLSEDMLRDISHVKCVNLSWNPWDCSSCQLKNLRSVLEKHPSQCTNCFLCKEPDEHEGRFVLEAPRNEDACGPPDHFRIYGVPTLLCTISASLVGYFIYRNRWYCVYGLLYVKVAVKSRRRQARTESFLWDGFLSYHTSDAQWVREVLLPKLESAPMTFRLCVAERDFMPGVPIIENIFRAIAQSRVSLFVLSREFCRSRWCMLEVSLAQHRLFENDRPESMVFIRKTDVEVCEMSSTLAYLINSRTYVKLPPDGSSEALNNLFWLQVQAALKK